MVFAVISGVTSFSITFFLREQSVKIKRLIIIVIIVTYVGLLIILKVSTSTSTNTNTITSTNKYALNTDNIYGEWKSDTSGGRNAIRMVFIKPNKSELSFLGDSNQVICTFKLKNDSLLLFENSNEVFRWRIEELNKEKLIVSEYSDSLIFYKIE
jgi:hypothetical protein